MTDGSRPGAVSPPNPDPPLLDVRGLVKHYPLTEGLWNRDVGRVRAVDGIDLTVERGEAVALVGESGCGKSTAARAALRLDEPTDGTVRFDGEDVTAYDRGALKRFRRRARLIFQDPDSSFDPRLSIGESVAEPLSVHGMDDRNRRRRLVEGTLERVGLDASDADRFPHELSGGEKQRAALARALVTDPDLLVADEPVSALDTSVKADILELLARLRDELGLGVLLITHDLGVVAEFCDRVAVMYLGEIVESGPVEAVFSDPGHPYTRALLGSVPVPDPGVAREPTGLVGDVPDAADPPSGCRFHTRCPEVIPPDEYDLEGDVWRRLFRFRLRVSGESPADRDDIVALASTELDPAVAPEDVEDDALRAAVRRAFDLPERLSDLAAESVLERAVGLLVDGEQDAAVELLESEFRTVCESESPAKRRTGADREAACHLVGEADAGADRSLGAEPTSETD
ncbi:ABC transporter ATP-binding protein [Halobellus rufus]|uniref:ABC transporter ATP-binding protein n=1 Tax=Halobellus rufus TaxID=1448860 RepID=UPI000678CE97|nr:oligopeptide/dipeptide ABC transporter ATP-binding protein [Halobellus rufus]